MSHFSRAALEQQLAEVMRDGQILSSQIKRALGLAFEAHQDQFREQISSSAPKIPYIAHPVGVARVAITLLPSVHLTVSFDDLISACLTHDILEDTQVSVQDLEKATSPRAATLVLALTKPPIAPKQTRFERNRRFVEQIVNAGAAACFIKICDAIHNLSRPKSMPPELLTKTIGRAAQDYLPLTDNPNFSSAIREALEARIREAQRVAETAVREAETAPYPTLESALTRALRQGQSKVLEEHDIAATVESLCKPRHVFVGGAQEYLRLYLDDLRTDKGDQASRAIVAQLGKGQLTLGKPRFDEAAVKERNLGSIFSTLVTSIGDRADEARYVFVAAGPDTPQWLGVEALTAIVAVLSQRLRARASRQLVELAEALALLGLSLDPALVHRARLGHGALVALKKRLDAADYVHRSFSDAIKRMTTGLSSQVDRIESRIKSAQSIVQKMLDRAISDIAALDDLVGFRIIVLSTSAQEKLCKELRSQLVDDRSELVLANPVVGQSVQVDNIYSDDGYRATHIRFRALTSSRKVSEVTCEIQIRTVYEDAWARVSQMVRYKKSANANRTRATLKELANTRDECDTAINKLDP